MSATVTVTEHQQEDEIQDEIRLTGAGQNDVRNADLVIFEDCSKGLGIKICGGYNECTELDFGIFIKCVLPGGLADIQGDFRDGDQILAVNSESLEGVTNESAVAILRKASASNHVKIVVTRDNQARSEFLKILEKQNGYAGSYSCTPIPTEVQSKASSRATTPSIQGGDNQKRKKDSDNLSPHSQSIQSYLSDVTKEDLVLDFEDDLEHVLPQSLDSAPLKHISDGVAPQQFTWSSVLDTTSTPRGKVSPFGIIDENCHEPSPVSAISESRTIPDYNTNFSPAAFSSLSTSRNMSHSRKLSLDPHVRLKIDKLEVTLHYLGIEPTPEQQVSLRETLKVDPDGMVMYGDFVEAALDIFHLDLEQSNISTGAMYYAANDPTDILEPPAFTSNAESSPVENYVIDQNEDFETVKRQRNELRLEVKRLNKFLGEQNSSCRDTEEDLLNIRREAQKAIEETHSLRSKVHLSETAQRAARGMEQDYEEVVTLLEQEIAALRLQMAKQNENNPVAQKRLAVLSCQLRKTEAAKRTYEVATDKLLQFAEQVHEIMSTQEYGLTMRSTGNEGATARGAQPPGFLAKHKRLTPKSLASEAKDVVKSVNSILEAETLPFGWEEAYTADGIKYYINHLTQLTTWSHPMSNIQHLPQVPVKKNESVDQSPPQMLNGQHIPQITSRKAKSEDQSPPQMLNGQHILQVTSRKPKSEDQSPPQMLNGQHIPQVTSRKPKLEDQSPPQMLNGQHILQVTSRKPKSEDQSPPQMLNGQHIPQVTSRKPKSEDQLQPQILNGQHTPQVQNGISKLEDQLPQKMLNGLHLPQVNNEKPKSEDHSSQH